MSGSRYRTLAVLALFGLSACGGASNGPPSGATATVTVPPGSTATATVPPGSTATVTVPPGSTATATPTSHATPSASPTPNGSSSILPPICQTGRVVFSSSSGEQCCVAVDPALLPPKPTPDNPGLILTDLPIGPATVTISCYTGDFAPAPPGVAETCKAVNPTGVASCDTTRNASPAYESDPTEVTIIGGTRVNLGNVDVLSLPFVLDYVPPQNTTVPQPVDMEFTVVDATTGVARDSVGLEITLSVPQGEPPVFRPITKRVPLELVACADGGDLPCSPDGSLNVTGFKAKGVAEYLGYLPAGPVEARITAQNLAEPPRGLDFSYMFMVLPPATETPTPTSTPIPSNTPTVPFTATPTNTPSATYTPTASPSSTVTSTVTPTPSVTPTRTDTPTRTATTVPTTPLPSRTPMPTPTTLCAQTPRGDCHNPGRSLIRLKIVDGDNSLNWRWLDGTVLFAELGNPLGTTPYALCIYDSTNQQPALTIATQVEPGGQCPQEPCWSRIDSATTRGYVFDDKFGAQYGMKELTLRSGNPTRDSLVASASGENLMLPLPFGNNQYFAQQDDVIVQLQTGDAGCWQSVYRPGDVVENIRDSYQAMR